MTTEQDARAISRAAMSSGKDEARIRAVRWLSFHHENSGYRFHEQTAAAHELVVITATRSISRHSALLCCRLTTPPHRKAIGGFLAFGANMEDHCRNNRVRLEGAFPHKCSSGAGQRLQRDWK
jgi:hypothetical protein